jgi:hypothetical protein
MKKLARAEITLPHDPFPILISPDELSYIFKYAENMPISALGQALDNWLKFRNSDHTARTTLQGEG